MKDFKMNNRFLRTGVTLFLVLVFNFIYGQVNLWDAKDLSQTKVESYSDEEIKSLYDKAIQFNLNEEKLMQLLMEKGLPDNELEKLKNRIIKMSGDQGQRDSEGKKISEPRKKNIDAGIKKYDFEEQEVKRDYSIYGTELFSRHSMVFEPNIRIATPSNYVLGPDDEIILNIYGFSEKKYNLEINQDGQVYIPNVGPVFLSGLTVEQATQKITAKLSSTIYTAIKSGKTSVQLSLGKIRSIRVSVIGEATKPGSYTVSSLTTLFNLLYLCGGPNDNGSFRKIELVRGNKVSRVVDLYNFLLNGNQSDNVLLQEGDLIRIPFYQSRVRISGSIKRPGKYEMVDKDSVSGLLLYCGGFTDMAYRKKLTIFRIAEKEKMVVDLNADSFSKTQPQSGDEYFAGNISNRFSNRVTLGGAVFRPGHYELLGELDLLSLIDNAGGLKEEAYAERVTIFRFLPNRNPTTVSVNLDSLRLFDKRFFLVKDDSIYVRSLAELKESQTVSVEGYVNQPGIFPWRDRLSLGDLILMAGGLSSQADSTKVEISRMNNVSVKKTGNFKEVEKFILSIGGKDKTGAHFELKPYDIISVKIMPGVVNQRSVLLTGDVIVPGRYILETSNDRVSDIIRRADGLRYSPDSCVVFIRRPRKSNFSKEEREKLYNKLMGYKNDTLRSARQIKEEMSKEFDLIGVNINDLMQNKLTVGNVQLNEGDMIVVNRLNNLVKISGEVSYPNIVTYIPGKRLKYYVKKSGGFISTANKTKSIVIYPDGSAMGIKKFLIFKKYPKITPDSEVFVPIKDKTNKNKIGIAEMTLIISALGVITNLFISLNK
jgi:protein involved in polysaccharide export with SLBB domain